MNKIKLSGTAGRRLTKSLKIKPRLNKPILVLFKTAVYTAIFSTIHGAASFVPALNAPLAAFIVTMLIIVPNRGKMTKLVQRFVDRSFFYSQYLLKKRIAAFSQELNSTIEYGQLTKKLATFLDSAMEGLPYAIYVYNGTLYERIVTEGQTVISGDFIRFLPDSKLFEEEIDFHHLNTLRSNYPEFQSVLNQIDATQYQMMVPLQSTGSTSGLIFFDQRIEGLLNQPDLLQLFLQLARKGANILENARIHTQIKRKALQDELLLDIVHKISAILNLNEVLESIINNLARLMTYDAAVILLVDRSEKPLQKMAMRGYDEAVIDKISVKINQGVSGWVIRTQRGVIIPDVSRDPDYFPARPQTRSQITVPILSRGEAIGALVAESDELEHFTNRDLELLTLFSGLAAVAIRNAQLYEDSIKKQRLENELVVASKVQQALLRRRFPTLKGLSLEVVNIPSLIVGGDLYDVVSLDRFRQGLMIGDVSGKGTPAAILMAVTYAGFKSLLKEIDPVSTVIARLNNLLYEATSSGYYTTFFYGIIDTEKQQITYTNAGHNPPMLLRSDGTVEQLTEGGMLLGFLPNRHYKRATVSVSEGDYLILFTDGVTEIMDSREEEFGDTRLMNVLQENYGSSPKNMRKAILKAIQDFSGSKTYQDDLTLLIVRIEGLQ